LLQKAIIEKIIRITLYTHYIRLTFQDI